MTQAEAIKELEAEKALYISKGMTEKEAMAQLEGTPDGTLINALNMAIQALEVAVLTPQEFKDQMHDIRVQYGDNEEIAHSIMDGMMCDLLIDLGYGEGVAEFEAQNKWYAQKFQRFQRIGSVGNALEALEIK